MEEEGIENNEKNIYNICDLINNSYNLNMNQNNDNSFNNLNIDSYDKDELNKYKININISELLLKEICKNYLIDLILFLKNCCQITIEEKDAIFKHNYFKIEKNINNINEYLIAVKYDEDERDNNQNKDIDDINTNNYLNSEEGKIINIIDKSDKKQKLLNRINQYFLQKYSQHSKKQKPFICLQHGKKFKTEKDYNTHCVDMHKFKCEKCNNFFKEKNLFDKHSCDSKNNKNNNINEINKNDEYGKIKIVENDKINYFENKNEEVENKKSNEDEWNRQLEKLKYFKEQKNDELKEMNFNECLNIEKKENNLIKKLNKEQNKIKKKIKNKKIKNKKN